LGLKKTEKKAKACGSRKTSIFSRCYEVGGVADSRDQGLSSAWEDERPAWRHLPEKMSKSENTNTAALYGLVAAIASVPRQKKEDRGGTQVGEKGKR